MALEENSEQDFLKPGALEALIQNDRIPLRFGSVIEGNDKPKTVFWLPPEGVKRGDTIQGSAADGFFFTSPEGKERGWATMHIIPQEIGQKVQAKVGEILKTLVS